MKKIAFTFGDFDCINQDHIHLIKEMRKIVMPDNEVSVVLIDDYASFVILKKFPIQDLNRRANNLSFFVKDIMYCYADDPSGAFMIMLDRITAAGAQPVYVGYDDNKDFPGRELLKERNVPVRFIRKQNAKSQDHCLCAK